MKLIFLIGLIFLMGFVFASPLPPSPNCEIIGQIVNISCDYCEPSMLTVEPMYNFVIFIKNISYVNGSLNYSTCEDDFVVGKEQRFYDDTPNFEVGEKVRLFSQRQPYSDESPIQSIEIIENYCETDSNCPNPRPAGVCGGCFGKCDNNQCMTLCVECPKLNIFQRIINWFRNLF